MAAFGGEQLGKRAYRCVVRPTVVDAVEPVALRLAVDFELARGGSQRIGIWVGNEFLERDVADGVAVRARQAVDAGLQELFETDDALLRLPFDTVAIDVFLRDGDKRLVANPCSAAFDGASQRKFAQSDA